MFKLNNIFRKKKSYLPNPVPGLKLVFKKRAIEDIKRVKGWKDDKEMAQALGFTRAYISMLSKGRVEATVEVIKRLAYVLGGLTGKWWVHYEIIDSGEPVDPDHPLWNQAKLEGQILYNRYSSSAELRSRDYRTETRSFRQEFPLNDKVKKNK